MPVSVAVNTMLEKLNLKFSGLYACEELRKTLTRADRDHSGTLSLTELQVALSQATGLEPELEHVVALLRHYGIDYSSDVDYNEFTYRMMMGNGTTGLDTRRVFSHAGATAAHAGRGDDREDTDAAVGVSHILQQIAKKKTQANLPLLLRSFDEHKTGAISYAQFMKALAVLNLQLTGSERDALCSHIDKHGSGEIE
jgi:Ca2+-binding EF-hand superfamily protein